MKLNKILCIFILVYVFLSSILRISGSGALESNADRIATADFVGIILILSFGLLVLNTRKAYINNFYILHLPLFLVFLLSAIFSQSPINAIIEILAILLGLLISLSIVNIVSRVDELTLIKFLKSYTLLIGLISFVFLIDFFIFNVFSRPVGGLTGTFRNTGQAGSFLGVHLAIVLSLALSRLVIPTKYTILSILLTLIALIFTFKRAAIIGFLVGGALLIFRLSFSKRKYDKKIFIYFVSIILLCAPIFLTIFEWGVNNIEGLSWRVESKFSQDTVDKFQDGFLSDNIAALTNAFNQSPLLGIGLGNVELTSFGFEIHSSYLSIIATSGLIGSFFYFFTLCYLIKTIYTNQLKKTSPYSLYLYYFLPLFFGLLISWAYTNHLRKREYWFLVAIILIVINISKKKNSRM